MRRFLIGLTGLLLISNPAIAADYYGVDIFTNGDGADIAYFVDPASISDAGSGQRIAKSYMLKAKAIYIDESETRFDCPGRRMLAVSDHLINLGTDAVLDDFSVTPKGWRTIDKESEAELLLDFVCNWPRTPDKIGKVTASDPRDLGARVLVILHQR
jgi:hypothetical protein